MIRTHSDGIIKVVKTLMRTYTNHDAVIKTVELMTLLRKAKLRKNQLDCPFSEARQPLYIQEGNMND